MAKSKAPIRGRTPVYDPDYHPRMAFKYALLGFTDEEIAESFRISAATYYEWLQQHDEFSEDVRRGKAPADADVALGLFKRGTGYEYASEKIMTRAIGGGESVIERVDITVHVPPDPGAALNWLKNRQPDKWRDKKSLELEDADGEAVAFPVVRIYGQKPEEPQT